MSSVLVGLLIGLGVAAWTYSKAMRRTGDNTRSALTLAGVVGFIAFVIGFTVMLMVNSLTEG